MPDLLLRNMLTMLGRGTLAKTRRQWELTVVTAVAGFAIGVLFLGISLSVTLALVILSFSALVAFAGERRHNLQVAVALNNMTQGLSMYDSAARLVLCNERYIEMSLLPPENFYRGVPFREILVRRAEAGSFSGDPDRYVADCLMQAAEGRAEAKTLELNDGRAIWLVFRPLPTGGWVSTHPTHRKARRRTGT